MKVRPAALIVRDRAVLTMRYQYGNEFVHVLPGGNPDAGESLPEALARELAEELNVEVEVGEMIMAGEVLNFRRKEDTLHCLFVANLRAGEPEINTTQTTAQAVEWIQFEDLPQKTLYPNFAVQLAERITSGQFIYSGPLDQVYVS